ncbi:MAG TPA: hypothetical protein VD997_12230 [Phycisphaerales bacterium]|nr:hypothetical protein [Phycisphaerales bacterium]
MDLQRSLMLGLAAVTIAAQAFAEPVFVGIGALESGRPSQVAAVSRDGRVVVGQSVYTGQDGPVLQATSWTLAGGMTGLGIPDGRFRSMAQGVSADGSVIGGITLADGFRWTSSTGTQSVPGTLNGNIWGVSGNGQYLVGEVTDTQLPFARRAFRWSEAGGLQELGFIDGSQSATARGVNGDGSVIVGSSVLPSSPGVLTEAFRWTESGGMVNLGSLSGHPRGSVAYRVTTDGSIVVGSVSHSSLAEVAFRWTAADGMVALGAHPSGGGTVATGVSADGNVIVGTAAGDFGFIWTPAGRVADMKSYFLQLGLSQVAGWTLYDNFDVSDDGRVIVGTGVNPEGRIEGFYAVIPAPGAIVPLALGALLASRRRR